MATAGIVRKEVLQQFGMKGDVIAGEIDLERIAAAAGGWKMAPVSRFPGIPMVLGLLHGRDLPFARLVSEVRDSMYPISTRWGCATGTSPTGAPR